MRISQNKGKRYKINISKFNRWVDGFSILDLIAQFYFKTETSIEFLIGTGPTATMTIRGRVEVHHPCRSEAPGSAVLRGTFWLPAKYLNRDMMTEALKTICSVLEIAPEERHHVGFFESGADAYQMVDWFIPSYSPI